MPETFSRREFIAQVGMAAAGLAASGEAGSSPIRDAHEGNLTELSAGDAVRAMVRGEISAESYAAALLHRCEASRELHAFITMEPQRVLENARECDLKRRANAPLGKLHGIPIPVKDSVNTKDYPTTAGTPGLRRFRPTEDAMIVRALRGAGAIVLGKTNMAELSFDWVSNNVTYGSVRNPYSQAHTSGGSSGGTAAAIAARMAPLGVAEDTEGSIRIPAALCGITGFRPTTGRYPTEGVVPITPLFDQIGPHARCVADVLLFDSVFAPLPSAQPTQNVGLQGIKLGISRKYWFANLHPEVERIATESLRRLQEAGAELVEADVPDLSRLIERSTAAIQSYDFQPSVTEYLRNYHAGLSYDQLLVAASSDIKKSIADYASPGGRYFASKESYLSARSVYLPALRDTLQGYFARTGVTAIVFPTTMAPAPLIGEKLSVDIRGSRVPFDAALGRNVDPASTAGLPGLVLPAGLTADGLPVALEFDGPAGTDRALLFAGLALESALGRLPAPILSKEARPHDA